MDDNNQLLHTTPVVSFKNVEDGNDPDSSMFTTIIADFKRQWQ
ncbi:hypothetical protein [Nostoc sp.]